MRIALIVGLVSGCWTSSSPPTADKGAPPPSATASPREEKAPAQVPAEAEGLPARSVWRGYYDCRQGKTGLQLTLETTPQGTATAIFDFGAHAGNPDLPSGSYRLTGTVTDTNGLLQVELEPERWILQPDSYVMVGMRVTADAARKKLVGRIDHIDCGKVALQRYD